MTINEFLQKFRRVEHGMNIPVFMKESLRGLMGEDFRQEFPWEVSADDA